MSTRTSGLRLAVLVAVMALASACGGGGEQSSASGGDASTAEATGAAPVEATGEATGASETSGSGVVGISVKTITNDPFQQAWVEAAEAELSRHGFEPLVLTAGGQTAVASQVNQVTDMITRQVDGMIVNPIDGEAIVPVLEEAKAAGIPVVVVDSAVAEGNEDLYVSYIATDNVEAARQLASYAGDVLGDDAKVAIIEGAAGSLPAEHRTQGFIEGLAEHGLEPAAQAAGDWDNAKALAAMENILTANPDLDAVLSASDVMIQGIFQALESAGKSDVQVFSIDGSTLGIQAVIDGDLVADNTQNPVAMGQLAAETIAGIIDGSIEPDSVPKFVDSGTETVTKENAEDALDTAF
jgi:ribose transport system substrate-binding protein